MFTKIILIVSLLMASLYVAASDLSSCATSAGRDQLVSEYIKVGLVPACGPQCAQDFILSQVCEMKVKPNCYTQAGKILLIQEYVKSGKPVPACGPQCAQDFILSQVCSKPQTHIRNGVKWATIPNKVLEKVQIKIVAPRRGSKQTVSTLRRNSLFRPAIDIVFSEP